MNPILTTVIMFGGMFLLMATGLPIAFSLGAVAIISAITLWGVESLGIVYFTVMDLMNNFMLVSAALFVYMGFVIHESGIAGELFSLMKLWGGRLRGALAMGTVVICAIMAGMVGVSGAETLSIGVIAIPGMLEHKYDKKIVIGAVQAGGALSFIIPPSMMMILYGFLSGVSVGKLFAAGIIPGLILALSYIIYIGIICYLNPSAGPALPAEERGTLKEKIVATKALILPGALIVAVLGSIFTGIASTTEASAVGAVGSLFCAAIRGKLSWNLLKNTAISVISPLGFVSWLVIAAIIFSTVYTGLGAPAMITSFVINLDASPWTVLILIQLSFFILGMVLDDLSILFMFMPMYLPIVKNLGFDPVWFAILYVVNMQMAYITPPYGANLFYVKAIAPEGVTMNDIYRSAVAFVIIQGLCLVLFMLFPQIVLFLPNLLFSS